jgi:hypothetical protein
MSRLMRTMRWDGRGGDGRREDEIGVGSADLLWPAFGRGKAGRKRGRGTEKRSGSVKFDRYATLRRQERPADRSIKPRASPLSPYNA